MANIPLVIPSEQAVSGSVSIGTARIVGIQMPASVWTAAPISFLAAIDGVNFFSIFRNGNELIIPVQFGILAKLNKNDFSGTAFIKVQSGSVTNGLIDQAAAATLVLVTE